jgi:putative transposase
MSQYKALLFPDKYYHVFNRAVGNEHMFIVPENYSYFLHLFYRHVMPVADVFSYCLLPNHFHFFIRIKEEASVFRQMGILSYNHMDDVEYVPNFLLQQFSNLFNAYTKALNKQQDRKGKLFMEPFNRREVATPDYYTRIVHYIHANPVHHGFCKSVSDWVYSSYRELVSTADTVLKRDEVIRWFGTVDDFKLFHEQPIIRKFA